MNPLRFVLTLFFTSSTTSTHNHQKKIHILYLHRNRIGQFVRIIVHYCLSKLTLSLPYTNLNLCMQDAAMLCLSSVGFSK
ncbi:hypothetical protein AAHE18_16G048800 [Arachis hypogaea]